MRRMLSVLWHSRHHARFFQAMPLLIRQHQVGIYIQKYQKSMQKFEKYYHAAHTPILIYQMMKVGSNTVRQTLASVLDQPILHIHFLAQDNLTSHCLGIEREHEWRYVAKSLPQMNYLYSLIKNTSAKNRWKVIVLVRDPIARNISLFFHLTEQSHDHDLLITSHECNEQKQVAQLLRRYLSRRTGGWASSAFRKPECVLLRSIPRIFRHQSAKTYLCEHEPTARV